MSHLKLFKNHSEYEDFVSGGTMVKPNVSYCINEDEVHYKPLINSQFFCKLTLQDNSVIELEGSGELTQAMVSTPYKNTLVNAEIGELCTSIGHQAFYVCKNLTSVTIPNSVTKISSSAFYACTGLLNITIPSSVTNLESRAFYSCHSISAITIPDSITIINPETFSSCYSLTSVSISSSVTKIDFNSFKNCSGLTSIMSSATTAPTIQNSTFQGVKNGGTLIVPSDSSGYDVWMGTGDYYLGKYNWTKVEQ